MRNVNVRAVIFLVAALLLASFTGIALYGIAQQANAKTTPTVSTPTVTVVVAASDIAVRTVITAPMLASRQYPTDLVPTGAVTNVADALGRTTSSPIAAGQAIVQGQLAAATGNKAATLNIEKGKVLVAFPTQDPLTLGGLVNVGDHVDILASVTQGTGENAKVSQTTLQNLEVMDLIMTAKDPNAKEQTARPTALVFSVDHQVALVLKYLRDTQASIDLTVRSRAEGDAVKTNAVDLSFLVQTYGFR